MKVVDHFLSLPAVDEGEREDSPSEEDSCEESVTAAVLRVTVMEEDVSVQSDLLSPQTHPIDAVVERRSWMDDGSSSCRTDDDELRREMERLNYAEKEIRQDIQRASQYIQKDRAKNRKDRVSVNTMSKIDIELIERDARDSPHWSYPSDEAYNGEDISEGELSEASSPSPFERKKTTEEMTRGSSRHEQETSPDRVVHLRDPPEEVQGVLLSRHTRKDCGEDIPSESSTCTNNTLSRYDDPGVSLSACQVEESVDQESVASQSIPKPAASGTDDCFEEMEDAASTMSNWAVRVALELPDLERGKEKDIFDEETFWKDGLWKSDSNSPAQKQGHPSEETEQKGAQRGGPPTSSEDDHSEEGSEHFGLTAEVQDRSESNQSFPHGWEEHTDGSLSEEWFDVSKALSQVPEPIDQQCLNEKLRTFHDTQVNARGPRSSDERENSTETGGENGDSKYWCSFRRPVLIITVHLVLVVIGFIVLAQFLKGSDEARYDWYPPPDNDECGNSLVPRLTVNSTIPSTLFGATSDKIPCLESDHEMVWYNVVGTGAPIVVSLSDSAADLYVSILSGSCGDFACIGSSESSSVVWIANPEELYQVLVYGEPSSSTNFSLSITESPLNNEGCEKSAMILTSKDGGNVSISGTIDSAASKNSLSDCDFVADAGAAAWFSLLGNGNYITASICDGSSAVGETHLRLFSGRCNNLDCISTQHDSSSAVEPKSSVSWVSEHEEVYHVMVASLDANDIDFELCIEQSKAGISCESSIPVAILLADDSQVDIFGNIEEILTEAVPSNQFDTRAASCEGNGPSTSVIWYSVIGTGYLTTATTCGSIDINFTAIFDVFTGSCTDLRCVTNETSASCGASGQQYLSWDTVLGQQYWIVVSGDTPQSRGNFSLNLSSFGGFGELDGENRNLQDSVDRAAASVCFSSNLGAPFAAFALIAWRWRRLKRMSEKSL